MRREDHHQFIPDADVARAGYSVIRDRTIISDGALDNLQLLFLIARAAI